MPPFHGKHIQRILIVKPSSLGDIMHTFPALALLRRRFPHAKMDWMVNPAFADAVLYSPFPVRSRIYFNRKMSSLMGSPVSLLNFSAKRTLSGLFSKL